jgi:hypothetical protein
MKKQSDTEAAAADAAAAEAAAAEQASAKAAAAEQTAAKQAATMAEMFDAVPVGPGKKQMRFVETHEVQDEHRRTPRATVYLAGEVYELSEGSAQHFEARGKAVPV